MQKIVFSTLLLMLLVACSKDSSHILSKDIESPLERVQTLSLYFNLRTQVQDTQFDIFDVNLSSRSSVPGASSRDFKIALLLNPADIDAWLSDVSISSLALPLDWTQELVQDQSRFIVSSEPEYFTASNKTLILYSDEGIIFIRIRQD